MPPTATWSAGNISFNSGGGTMQIGAGDVLNITGADLASLNFNGGLWHNAGTVNRTTSATTASIGVPFENDGAVNVNTGTLSLGQGDGAGSSSGTFVVASGAKLAFAGGDLQLAGAGARIGGAGTARFAARHRLGRRRHDVRPDDARDRGRDAGARPRTRR